MNLGLFGGSFDPIHHGHLHIAKAFADELNLESVLFLPAGQPYHKDMAPVSAEHRLAMIELAIQCDSRFAVSDCDLIRTGKTYTADTIQIFRQHFPQAKLWWLMGLDSLLTLHTWKNWQYITQYCHIAVAARSGNTLSTMPKVLQQWCAEALQTGRLHLLKVPLCEVSATQVRQAIKNGQIVDFLPLLVQEYIKNHNLYQ